MFFFSASGRTSETKGLEQVIKLQFKLIQVGWIHLMFMILFTHVKWTRLYLCASFKKYITLFFLNYCTSHSICVYILHSKCLSCTFWTKEDNKPLKDNKNRGTGNCKKFLFSLNFFLYFKISLNYYCWGFFYPFLTTKSVWFSGIVFQLGNEKNYDDLWWKKYDDLSHSLLLLCNFYPFHRII